VCCAATWMTSRQSFTTGRDPMRAALALTNSGETQRLLTEIDGPDMHFITVALPPGERQRRV